MTDSPDSNRYGHHPNTISMEDVKNTYEALGRQSPFGPEMVEQVQRFIDTQKLLGGDWPQSEYLLCRLSHGDYRFRRFTPSDSAYPHFERPFTARRLMLARNRSAGWTIGHR